MATHNKMRAYAQVAATREQIDIARYTPLVKKLASMLVARLPADCRCLVFTQGALIGSGAGSRIADLTPQLRRQLGLEESR